MNAIELPSTRLSHRPTVQIQELVALSYGLNPKAMTGKSREPRHVWPRYVAMYLTRELTHRSLFSIGCAFGHRHHTTVLHGLRVVERRMAADPLDEADVLALREVLAG